MKAHYLVPSDAFMCAGTSRPDELRYVGGDLDCFKRFCHDNGFTPFWMWPSDIIADEFDKEGMFQGSAADAEEASVHLKVGDVVQLKSGGPVMTIGSFSDENEVRCVWWSSTKDFYECREFVPQSLKKVDVE